MLEPEAINNPNSLYNPGQGNIMAAGVSRLLSGVGQDAEWHLLQGGRKSPVQKLLAQTYKNSRCLIFPLDPPCIENRPYNILQIVSNTCGLINNNSKAFVFQQIYQEAVTPQRRLQAWNRLHDVPLLRCDNNGCRDFGGNNPSPKTCLAGIVRENGEESCKELMESYHECLRALGIKV
ncbi:hypothetical protein KIL84_002005 [Mauremys mutica]|uniref:Uncharacterized protein n=1 Tax=Mauremys mutica TaxID=74926 RepID=A0A9D3XK79_9SAUR|nr:hypothetical protein KIL84_002005 [Mauremys mutica]